MTCALASVLLLGEGCLDPDAPGNLIPRTVDEDPELPRIEIADTVFHAETYGNPLDPIIMVLHGGPGADYRSLLPLRHLADDGYHVVFWDQRGAGLSRRHDADEYSFEQYLEDLRLVLEHYTASPEQPVVFVGHSWGAMYATWFIDEHGDYGGRLKGAVLSEPGGFTKAQIDAYFKRFFGSVSVLDEDFGDMVWRSQLISPAEHARADFLILTQTPDEHINVDDPGPSWRFGAVVQAALFVLAEEQGFDWTTNLSEFEPEVLFLRGEFNEAMPLEHQEALASSYPHSQVITIPGTGHDMIWEAPDEYLEYTRAYFDRIGFIGGAP